MLSPDLLQQVRNIELKAGRLVTDVLAGEYVSAFRGLGMEFDRVREYEPGDDIRTIDWNVTARVHSPYVKVFKEERELTLFLMVDVSASQNFGSCGKFKNESAAELAAVLAFLATKNNDKVGLILFSDHVETFIPPKKGRSHIWNIIRQVLTFKASGRKTDIKGALDFFNKVSKRKSMGFLLSDFQTENYGKALELSAHKHDLICVDISDLRESILPNSGYLTLEDAETGESLVVDTSRPKVQDFFKAKVEEEKKKRLDFFRRHKVDCFSINTRDSVVGPLVKYMHVRERRSLR